MARMPARTARGMRSAIGPRNRMTEMIRAETVKPATCVRPPLNAVTKVPGVTPPGRPPIRPAATLPMPCAPNSWLGLCCEPGIVIQGARATMSVGRELNSAIAKAGCRSRITVSRENAGNSGAGSPCGIAPMVGAPVKNRTATTVPHTNTANCDGAIFSSRPPPRHSQRDAEGRNGKSLQVGVSRRIRQRANAVKRSAARRCAEGEQSLLDDQ